MRLVNESFSLQLKHKSEVAKIMVLEAITDLGPRCRPLLPELKELLQHPNVEVRVKTLQTLKWIDPEDKSTALAIAARIKSDSPQERIAAASTLNRLEKGLEVLPPFPLEALMFQDKLDLDVVALLGTKAKVATTKLISLLSNRETDTKKILAALGAIGPDAKEATPKLIELLSHRSVLVASEAAKALGLIGTEAKAALPRLKEMATIKDRKTRVWVLFALAKISGDFKTYIPKLIELHDDKSDLNAYADRDFITEIDTAMLLLGKNAKLAQPAMLAWIGSTNSSANLVVALSKFQDDANQIVPKLLESLKKAEPNQTYITDPRWLIIHALGGFGPKAKAAVPFLRQLLDDNSFFVSRAAFDALYRIEGK